MLEQSSEFDDFEQYYSSILLELKLISGANESTLDMCLILLRKKGTAGAITDILDEWARKQGKKAQLQIFIAIISKFQLIESASLLEYKFLGVKRSNPYSIFVGLEAAELQNSKNRAFEQMDTESDVFLQHSKAFDKTQQFRNRFPKNVVRSTEHPCEPQNAKSSEMRAYRNWMLSYTLDIIQIILIIVSTVTIIHCLPNAWGKIDGLLRETFKPKVGDLSRMVWIL